MLSKATLSPPMSESPIDIKDVHEALKSIIDPSKGTDILSADQGKSLNISGDRVSFVLEVDPTRGEAMEPLRAAAQRAGEAIDGVASVSAVLTAHAAAGEAKPSTGKGAPPDLNLGGAMPKREAPNPTALPNV